MRRGFVSLVLSMLLFDSAWAEVAVYFADPNLKARVENALWIADPTPSDMLALTSFTAQGDGIVDLTGLEYAINLEDLCMRRNRISDLSPLAGLANLRSLNMHENYISDISPLSGLSGLRFLDLHDNCIGDMSAVAGLSSLETLILESNLISDISAVAGLGYLDSVRLGRNQITDLTPLAGVNSLRSLSLYGNSIDDVSPLAGLTGLESLIISGNQIGDISPLTGLTSLEFLDLANNPLAPEACAVYIPQLLATNPGLQLAYNICSSHSVSISSTAGGRVVEPGEGEFIFSGDSPISIKAKADPGFVFVGFTGSYSTRANPFSLTLDRDHQIRACFFSVSDVLYVDDDAPGEPAQGDPQAGDPLEDGTTEHPFDCIQEAIEVASPGAIIVVRPGVYRESINFLGKPITLTGIDVNDPQAGFPAVVGGDADATVGFTNGEDCNSVLQGFVIRDSRTRTGAAIFCSGSSPTIANCLIIGNRATDPAGAAVYCTNSRAVFINCTITDNYVNAQGAALFLVDSSVSLVNSILWGNTPRDILSAGASQPLICYSDVAGGWPGAGNINTDPLFARDGGWVDGYRPDVAVSPDYFDAVLVPGDYHLKSQAGRWDAPSGSWVQDEVTSPCIDAGTPPGQDRSTGGDIVDVGYYDEHIINLGAYGGTAEAGRSRPDVDWSLWRWRALIGHEM